MVKTTNAIVHTIYPVIIFEILDDCLVPSFSESDNQEKIDKITSRARKWYGAYKKFQNGKDKIEWLSKEENQWLTHEEK